MPKIKTFKFRTRSRRFTDIELPGFPQIASTEEEALTGQVQGLQASAGEENLALGLGKEKLQHIFLHTFGAPKGLPGWKQIDFIVFSRGLVYLVEVDSEFTHRNKQYADVLHDALALQDPELNSFGTIYPQVLHVDGELELSNQVMARSWVRRMFG